VNRSAFFAPECTSTGDQPPGLPSSTAGSSGGGGSTEAAEQSALARFVADELKQAAEHARAAAAAAAADAAAAAAAADASGSGAAADAGSDRTNGGSSSSGGGGGAAVNGTTAAPALLLQGAQECPSSDMLRVFCVLTGHVSAECEKAVHGGGGSGFGGSGGGGGANGAAVSFRDDMVFPLYFVLNRFLVDRAAVRSAPSSSGALVDTVYVMRLLSFVPVHPLGPCKPFLRLCIPPSPRHDSFIRAFT
jgi:hypothetical protein